MPQYSEDGQWMWDGTAWIPAVHSTPSPTVPLGNLNSGNISGGLSTLSSQFGSMTKVNQQTVQPRIVVSESGKKKLKLEILSNSGHRTLQFQKSLLGIAYTMSIDGNKPVLVTGKFGAFSKNTSGNGLTGFRTKTSHYLGQDLQNCELTFHYKSGLASNSIKKVEISSITANFHFSHEI